MPETDVPLPYQSLLLDEAQQEKIVMLMLYDRGEEGANEEELLAAIHWAEEAQMNYGILQNLLEGNLTIDVDANKEVSFAMTPKGMREGERLAQLLNLDLSQPEKEEKTEEVRQA